jgi:hypothetical protein
MAAKLQSQPRDDHANGATESSFCSGFGTGSVTVSRSRNV